MGTEWMGRYRPFIATLVKFSNVVQRISGQSYSLPGGVCLTLQEWEVFEYILEHQEDDACMNSISDRLGIAQSTFSKIAKSLCILGLVERYQAENNRKNIILRPSERGQEIYAAQADMIRQNYLAAVFDQLNVLDDDQLATITDALEQLNEAVRRGPDAPKPRLIKKD